MRFLAILLALISMSASGADIVFFKGSPENLIGYSGEIPDAWRPRIVFIGNIIPGDDKKFLDVLKQAEDQSAEWKTDRTLRLNSNGGDVATAMSIGRLVRKAQLTTIVQENDTCASACVLILAGGIWRIAWGENQIGLHRPYFYNAKEATQNGYGDFQSAYDAVLEEHRKYFSEMRIGSGLLERMVKISSSDVEWIDRQTATRLNLLGEDPTYSEWERAKRIAEKGQACVEWQDKHGICLGKLGFPASGVYEKCIEIVGSPPENCK